MSDVNQLDPPGADEGGESACWIHLLGEFAGAEHGTGADEREGRPT